MQGCVGEEEAADRAAAAAADQAAHETHATAAAILTQQGTSSTRVVGTCSTLVVCSWFSCLVLLVCLIAVWCDWLALWCRVSTPQPCWKKISCLSIIHWCVCCVCAVSLITIDCTSHTPPSPVSNQSLHRRCVLVFVFALVLAGCSPRFFSLSLCHFPHHLNISSPPASGIPLPARPSSPRRRRPPDADTLLWCRCVCLCVSVSVSVCVLMSQISNHSFNQPTMKPTSPSSSSSTHVPLLLSSAMKTAMLAVSLVIYWVWFHRCYGPQVRGVDSLPRQCRRLHLLASPRGTSRR